MAFCIMCSAKAVANRQDNASRTIYNCPQCGVFVVSDLALAEVKEHTNQIAAFLVGRQLSNSPETILISYDNAKKDKEYLQLTVQQILSSFPSSFTKKMDRILLNLEKLTAYGGQEIKIEKLEQTPLFFVEKQSYEALSYVIKSMHKSELIEVNYYGSAFFPCGVVIGPKGWDRIAMLKQGLLDDNMAFLVLPRGEEAWGVSMRLAARKALENSGFLLVENSSINSDGQIGNALLAQIKQSRLVICDLSDSLGENYYTAAMARTLGKITILTCHASQKSKLQINTDQISVLFWEDNKSLYNELYSAVYALI